MKPDRTETAPKPSVAEGRDSGKAGSIFEPGGTCWRVARADRISLIVDAADYFRVLRKVFIAARKELLLIGWDFGFELEMLPGESDENGIAQDGFPNQLGGHLSDFLDAYNYARRLKTLSGLTPYEYICKIWTSEPDLFILNPIHQMPGLNT